MKDLYKYLYKSILDEPNNYNSKSSVFESILDDDDVFLDNVDNRLVKHIYKEGMTKQNFGKFFSKLWVEIAQKSKSVPTSKVDPHKNYIVFQKDTEYGILDPTSCWYIKILIGVGSAGFKSYHIFAIMDKSHNVKYEVTIRINNRPRTAKNLLPRKSKFNDFRTRQIFELPDEYLFLEEIMTENYEKSK